MSTRKKIVIVGATSTIALHCARLWTQQHAAELVLVGRSSSHLDRVATDLQVRSPQSVIHVMHTDFLDPEAISATVRRIADAGPIDIALIAHGSLSTQAECQDDLHTARTSLEINGISPALFAEAFAREMQIANHGTLAVIGSVAGDRGRQSNYVYGAAKGMLARYCEGLQHRFASSRVKVVLIKPGPTDTAMTAHLKSQGARLAPVEEVAAQIVRGVNAGKRVVYVPRKWQLIMLIIRHLPAFVFNRLKI